MVIFYDNEISDLRISTIVEQRSSANDFSAMDEGKLMSYMEPIMDRNGITLEEVTIDGGIIFYDIHFYIGSPEELEQMLARVGNLCNQYTVEYACSYQGDNNS